MRNVIFGLFLLIGLSAVADAEMKQVRYIGIHPIAKSHGGGFCYIEGPHVHVYEADKLQYRVHDGAYVFVGDPVAFGYDGPKHVFKGHHPIHVDVVVGLPEPDVEWCYIDGPHYHYFPAVEGPEFKVVGGAAFYVGEPPKMYLEARPAFIGINAVYAPIVYARPTVAVVAPGGWIGARVDLGFPAVVVVAPPVPRAVVVAPGVHIQAGIGINVGVGVGVGVRGGGVIVGGKRKHR
jgi:hypothetical protein